MTFTPSRRVVVSGVANPAHLIYISSYLRQVMSSGPIEVLMPTRGRVDLTDPRMRDLLPNEAELILRLSDEVTCPPDLPLTYVAVGAPGLKPYVRLRQANPRRSIKVVVTDEGLGSYGTWRSRRAAWAREGVPEPWCTVRSLAVAAGARALTSQRWALYAMTSSGWTVVEGVAAEFRRRVAPTSTAVPSGRVVMLTQPWVELGSVSEADYLNHVEELAERVQRAGGNLVVRPHPSERAGRYAAFGELARARPAELDPEIVGAAAVIGGPSTALLNLAAVHGLPAARVRVPGRPDLDAGVGDAQDSLLHHFLGPLVDRRADLGRHLAL